MRKKIVYESALDEIRDYDWLSFNGNLINDDEGFKDAAKEWKVSPALVEEIHNALKFMAEEIIKATKADLEDIYRKLDEE